MANKCMKIYSMSYFLGEMQSNTTIKCYHLFIRMAERHYTEAANVGEDVVHQPILNSFLVGMKNGIVLLEDNLAVS